ncbi:MAG: RNA polymerase sigma-54 factor, partial [Bacteroidota bacterium]
MGANFGISLGQRQSQRMEQKLSPQVIQYIKLLAKTTLELEQRIKEEIEQNPLLEEGPPEEDTQQVEAVADETSTTSDEEISWDYESDDDSYGHKARVDDEERRELPTPYQSTMSEHLLDQLKMLDLDETGHLIAEQIIGSIDEDGYLRRPVVAIADDIAFTQGKLVSSENVERVLSAVQRLDPVGIASRDLKECLLVQLDVL